MKMPALSPRLAPVILEFCSQQWLQLFIYVFSAEIGTCDLAIVIQILFSTRSHTHMRTKTPLQFVHHLI